MRRRLLNLLTLLSLVLFVLLAAACVRSHLVGREYLMWGEATGLTWHRIYLRLGLIADTPYWPLLLLTGAPPAIHCVRARRRNNRRLAGSCPDCGYDLRAAPDRCPECGTAR